MRLVTFTAKEKLRYGIALDDGVIDLREMQRVLSPELDAQEQSLPNTLLELLRRENAGMDSAQEISEHVGAVIREQGTESLSLKGVYFSFDDITWRPPLPHTSRMFSMRGNNPILLRLDNLPMPQHPFITPRYHGRMIGHLETMVLRAVDREIGWGAEFAVVLGRGGKHISASEAKRHILGYTAINDMNGGVFHDIAPELAPRPLWAHTASLADPHQSALDDPNWFTTRDDHYAGKFYGTWSMPQPVGPWIVTADEIPDPYDLVVHSRESGTPCDTVTTAAMILKFEDVIEFMSSFMTLKAGDIISSGALGWHTIPGRDYYPPGSNFEIEIERIGALKNPIIDRRHVEPS